MKWATRFRKVRGDRSREQFAALLGVSAVTLWRWEEKGVTPDCCARTLLRLIESDPRGTIGRLWRLLRESD